jgi:phospholipid/cholesterol/gamma-HCH transport system substrate-binding protein
LKIKREVKIGVVLLMSLALMYFGFTYLKGRNLFEKTRYFYAVYTNVKGMMTANPITINGLKVGQVVGIDFLPNDSSARILVKFIIDNNIDIPSNSIARIESDLLGQNAINIRLGNSTRMASPGDTIASEIATTIQEEVSLQMLPVKKKAENLMLGLDSVLEVIRYIFNEETRENITRSFESIKNTIANLESTTSNIDTFVIGQRGKFERIITNVELISLNIRSNNEKISHAINNFSSLSDTLVKANLAHAIQQADRALLETADILEKVNRGEGSIGLLLNNDSLYRKLDKASLELGLLIEDMKLNPHRYVNFSVFGPRDKKQPASKPKK